MENTNPAPQPKTIDYNMICQVVGHLYIELHNSKSSLDGNYAAIIDNLTNQIAELIQENEDLKEEAADEGPSCKKPTITPKTSKPEKSHTLVKK